MSEADKPSYIASVLTNRCPRCRLGTIFAYNNPYLLKHSRFMKMNEVCPVCGQPTDIEVGFYYGTGYVSYAVSVACTVATFVAWWVLIGISVNDNRIFYWLTLNSILLLVLQPVLMRFSRSLWLSWFVKYNPEWRSDTLNRNERVVKEQMGNW